MENSRMKLVFFTFLSLNILTKLGLCSLNDTFRCTSSSEHSDADDQNKYEARITHGDPLSIDAAAHNVWILGSNLFCAGSIIGRKWILTAAHCYKDRDALTVYVGSDMMMGGEVFAVKKIHIHPEHYMNGVMPHHDYMLLELDRNLSYSKSVQPIQLAEHNNIKEGVLGTVSGFGYTSENDDISNYKLRSTQLPIIGYKKCLQYYNITDIPHNDIFCAGFEEGGKSICEGDSGGPFVVDGMLVGISTASDGCGRPKLPTIMSSVYFARPWICQITGI